MNVLVVDDLPENRYLLEQLLRAKGHTVASAKDGVEALEILGGAGFDLIISDIMMPRMDGFELCYNVKLEPKLKQIPFVFYTATYTADDDKAFALSLGADAFILKPQEPEEFVQNVERVLQESDKTPRGTIAQRLRQDQVAFLREYNARLVHKLETKVREAREANRRLKELNASLESRVVEKTRQLQRSNEELEAFARTLTHDLRASLRNIAGFADTLLESASNRLTPHEHEWLDRITSAVGRMDHMITEVLDYSRAGAGAVVCERVDLDALAREIVQAHAQFQGRVEVAGPLLPVTGHVPSLRQALLNLLGNAVKFVAPGTPPRVRLWTEPGENYVRLWIEDNGIGIPREQQAKIFQPFERLNSSYEGSGLGLAIVAKAVERMNGTVGVESQPGIGSRFWLELPPGGP